MRYSFIVPIYNDGHLAADFAQEFKQTFAKFLSTDNISQSVELIFVNDGSKNDSIQHLKNLASKYDFIKIIDFSRNFGQHIALTAGYQHATGQYVGMLNVDMEDPPAEIPKLIKVIEAGEFDIVTSLRTNRETGGLQKLTSAFFHWLLNKLTGAEFPVNCSTLRLMSRRFVNEYNRFSEKERYLPGLEHWLGFRHGYVETVQQKRKYGKSSYNFFSRLRFAFRTVLSFSSLPLKIAVTAGFAVAFIGFLLNIWLVISKVFLVDYQAGYTSTVSLLMFFGGTQIAVTGVVGLYVGKILTEVQDRPLYVIREKVGL